MWLNDNVDTCYFLFNPHSGVAAAMGICYHRLHLRLFTLNGFHPLFQN